MWRIKLLLAGAALALLGYGCVEILEYFKFSHVQAVPYAQFVQKRPQEGWFRITGVRPDTSAILRTPGRTSHEQRVYIPCLSSETMANNVPNNTTEMTANTASYSSRGEEPAFLVVETTRPQGLEVSEEAGAVGSFPSQAVEGMLVTGMHRDKKMRQRIAVTANVADDYVILEEGRKPSFLKGLGIIGLGLILAIGQILYYRSDWHDA